MNDDSSSEPAPDAVWSKQADEREEALPKLGPYPVAGLVRRTRRIADLSQRQLARRVGVAASTVGRIESGTIEPTLGLFQRILATAGLSLVVIDGTGHLVLPMRDVDDVCDGAGRRYPSHLDTILDPRLGEWWADQYGLARPPETFYRDRARRDARRARSRWEVRVQQNRGVSPPPDPDLQEYLAAHGLDVDRRPVRPPISSNDVDVDEWDEGETPPGGRGSRRRLGHDLPTQQAALESESPTVDGRWEPGSDRHDA
jgi:transcriptional regulator with XRE-family HTH domain